MLCWRSTTHRSRPPRRRPPRTLRAPHPPRSGRKRAAITYAVTYTLGCFTKHFNHFWILFCGRVFCGVATSLLYSAFESWLVAEHFKVCVCVVAVGRLGGSLNCCCVWVFSYCTPPLKHGWWRST